MTQLFANNAFSTLAGAITNTATSMSVQAGAGAKFPSPTGGDYFLVTLFQLIGGIESNHEVVKVTARSVDTFTIVRGQEGTTARAWGVGDQVSLRATAGSLGALAQLGAAGQAFSQPIAVPTASPGDNTTTAASTAFVTAAVAQAKADLIASSPAALDTLNELAAALGNDANFSATMTTALGNRLRVDVNTQGLNSTQKANAVTNLGLAAVATSGAKADVGLGNVDNTSDANKPVSTAAQAALDLKANLASPAFTGSPSLRNGTSTAAYFEMAGNNNVIGTGSMLYGQDQTSVGYLWNRANAAVVIGVNNSEAARFDQSGNLGVGTTSPAQKFHVIGNGVLGATSAVNGAYQVLSFRAGVYEKAQIRGHSLSTIDAGALSFWTAPDSDVVQERARIDQSGNCGLGIVPSAWYSTRRVFQIGTSSAIASFAGSNGLELRQNAYLDSGATERYIAAGPATLYGQYSGAHQWYKAASGSAGAAITFTQAMTLTANGNLLIGTTTDGGGALNFGASKGINSTTGVPTLRMYDDGTYSYGIAAGGNGLELCSNYSLADMRFFTGGSTASPVERMRLDSNGNILVNTTGGGNWHKIFKSVSEGTAILEVRSSLLNNGGFAVYGANAVGENAAACVASVSKNSSNGRSINAAGSLNASGADYAEYMTKAGDCGVIAKGQIVGVDVHGLLTDKWANAVSFLIKSTDPSYVGGDVWGNEGALGLQRPVEPTFDAPAYTGAEYPGDAPAAPMAPEDETDPGYVEALARYETIKAAYDAALTKYTADRQAHDAAVTAALDHFDTVTMAAYNTELTNFNAALEAARQKVDRIAYCGQVPVNVTGATPGQYVVPVQVGSGIGGQLINKTDITMSQYMSAVGIVQNILPDGRANVRVKVV